MGGKKRSCFTGCTAVLGGLIGYLILNSVVDFHAYTQSIVNAASIPRIAFQVILALVILLLMRKAAVNRPKITLW
jgi:hypothetical protein